MFSNYTDAWSMWRKTSWSSLYKTDAEFYQSELFFDPLSFRHAEFELNWRRNNKPYYDVYPCIVPMLKSLKLDFPSSQISKPSGLDQLLVRLPEGEMCKFLWISFGISAAKRHSDQLVNCVTIGFDFGERVQRGDLLLPVHEIRIIPLTNRNFDETIAGLSRDPRSIGDEPDSQIMQDYTKLALTICMLGEDEDLIQPQVLTDDERKLTEQNKMKLVDKARRRGKHGYSIGKDLDFGGLDATKSEDGKCPHYRKPHLAVVHYGKGRIETKIVLRRGSVINKSKLLEVPTGYLNVE